jgi:isoleucyl-tRNA synthetase
MEEEILAFWQKEKIFEKSVEKEAPKGDYVFYDGPPFATGTPHYGHIVASLMKDTVPRYWTMRGYRVERRWGWDCHGLPIENIVEQELKIKTKKEIEEKIGVEKFNEICRSKVLMYADEWKKVIPRIGRFVDMDNPYMTMDLSYMESIWWVFKQLYDKGLIYEGYKAMHICPRCETTLSQSEVSQGYKEIKDLSLVVKFELEDEPNTFLLAWTTTAWTLPGNVALAVGAQVDYLKIKVLENFSPSSLYAQEGEVYILAKRTAEKNLEGIKYEIIEEFKGEKIVGKSYQPLFSYFATPENRKKGFRVYSADFVSTEEGTGIVHIAPAFGEDDMRLGQDKNLPFIQHVTLDGRFILEVKDFAGEAAKPFGDYQATDKKIIEWLKKNNKLFSFNEYLHSYPHCWRCDTPLLNYATSSWFVKVTALKERMIKLAQGINWVPSHLKEGRFGKWLEGATDWSISRQRFWGSVLPIWRCQGKGEQKCSNIKVIGSIKELEELSGQKVNDLHKHLIDKITFPCEKCGGEMKRVPDVLDCWFESGSMPYAQFHYPFENKEKFEKNFPAEFIAEGVDQTRCWFYYLLVLSTALFDKIPFKNVIANGIVLAEDGQKMSKRLKNYPDPMEIVNEYGADALRYYLLISPVMKADTLYFSKKGVEEVYKKLILILWNLLSFYKIYATNESEITLANYKNQLAKHILDRWIFAELHLLIKTVTEQMNAYDLVLASRPIENFVNNLSTWWLRRSRERFKSSNLQERKEALITFRFILATLAKVLAPFIPFMAEKIYQETGREKESVHLEDWPEFDESLINQGLLAEMAQARKIVELIHALRAEAKIKVRQPLAEVEIKGIRLSPEILSLVLEEVNVKKGTFLDEIKQKEGWLSKNEEGITVNLSLELSEELKKEGFLRELVRQINDLRKEAGLSIQDRVQLFFLISSPFSQQIIEESKDYLQKATVAFIQFVNQKIEVDFSRMLEIGEETIWLGLKK